MRKDQYNNVMESLRSENRFLRLALLSLALLSALVAMVAYSLVGQEKTIVLPAEIRQSFWVRGSTVSKEYLEEMGHFVSGLLLSASPETAEYQKDQILKYAVPYAKGALEVKLRADIARLKSKGISTFFYPHDMRFLVEEKKVAITGDLQSFIADKRVSSKELTYLLAFDYSNGRLYVKDFYETNQSNPFTEKPADPQ